MATRAVFTFTDDHDTHHVYKHFDGYPKGAARALANTFPLAWEAPRFESDEFGAAFIAANKDEPGGLRLTDHWRDNIDIEYRYEIFREEKSLHIRALAVACSYPDDLWESRELFCGPLEAFIEQHAPEVIQDEIDQDASASKALPERAEDPTTAAEKIASLFEPPTYDESARVA